MWSNSFRSAVYAAVLLEYLDCGRLLSQAGVAETLGSRYADTLYILLSDADYTTFIVRRDWINRFELQAEDYLHGLITVVNELVSRIVE